MNDGSARPAAGRFLFPARLTAADAGIIFFPPSHPDARRPDAPRDPRPPGTISPEFLHTMKISTMALAAGAALLCASPARAQDRWQRQALAEMHEVLRALDQGGMFPAGLPVDGELGQTQSEEVELELTPGRYVIVGVCDGGCADLDLLLALDGELVTSDVEEDDTPVLGVEVAEASTFVLRVDMVACGTSPCRWAVGAFTTTNR